MIKKLTSIMNATLEQTGTPGFIAEAIRGLEEDEQAQELAEILNLTEYQIPHITYDPATGVMSYSVSFNIHNLTQSFRKYVVDILSSGETELTPEEELELGDFVDKLTKVDWTKVIASI